MTKLKILLSFLLLSILILPPEIFAQDKEKPFTLNGKPVPTVVASVNGVPLLKQDLKRDMFAFQFQSKQMGREVKPSDEPAIARQLIESLVARELVVQRAKSLGIKITKEKVDQQLKNVEDQFPSHSAFITALAFQHMSVDALKDKIQRTLLEDELMRLEIAPRVDVSEKAIKDYYDANIARFTKPVLYRIRHILIATIKSAGEADDEASGKKAERLTKMINEEARDKINVLFEKVMSGENFEILAKQFSEDEATKEDGGILGDLHPDSTIPEIAKEMVKLHEGKTSGIVKSDFGYHILKLDEIIPSQLIPFAETKTDIMNVLLKMETQKLFESYVKDLGEKAKLKIFI